MGLRIEGRSYGLSGGASVRSVWLKRKISSGLVVISLLFSILGSCAAAQGVNARNLLKLGRSAADSHDWAKARDYATEALKEEGGYLDAYYLRAFAYRELGQTKKAEDDFREVIRRDPKFLGTYGALADLYMSLQQWDQAEKVLSDLGRQDDGSKWASYYRGVMAYDRGELGRAEKMWRETLDKDPNFAKAAHNLGALALAKQEYGRALQNFRQALDADEDNPRYRFHVAWVLERLGRLKEAQDLCKKLQDGGSAETNYWLLARALDQLTRKQDASAIKILDNVLKDEPDSLDGLVLKARALIALGQHDEARTVLEKARKLDPNFSEIGSLLKALPQTEKKSLSPVTSPSQGSQTGS